MDWIKKHYEQFALALLAAALLAMSVMLMLRAQGFGSTFAAATATAIPHDKVEPFSLDRVEKAKEILENPPQWAEAESHDGETPGSKKRGSLFVSEPYVISQKDQKPRKPGNEYFYKDTLTGKPMPNIWFMANRLPLMDTTVPLQDADKDGFNNEDEWRGLDPAVPGTKSTDPNSKDSHPPYYYKLFVKELIQVPFRVLFQAYNGDIKKPETLEFQINKVGGKSTEFLKLGEKILNGKTVFLIQKFEFKERLNDKTGEKYDVSELTLLNTETNLPVVLVRDRVTNSPDFFMKFIYKWPNQPQEFIVKKLGEFGLKPNDKERYKLIDSTENKAVIQTPDGKQVDIIRDPRDKK